MHAASRASALLIHSTADGLASVLNKASGEDSQASAALHQRYRHQSAVLDCLCHDPGGVSAAPGPRWSQVPGACTGIRVLTCTDETSCRRAGAIACRQPRSCPDRHLTPAPGRQVSGGSGGRAWDFGHGAGFYLNASSPPGHATTAFARLRVGAGSGRRLLERGTCPSNDPPQASVAIRWEGTGPWVRLAQSRALQLCLRHSPNSPPQPLPLGQKAFQSLPSAPIAAQLECLGCVRA